MYATGINTHITGSHPVRFTSLHPVVAFAATPAQTPRYPAQHTVTTTATVQDTTATEQNKTAVPANTVVNQQLRSGVFGCLQRISKMCDHTSSPMYQVILGF